MVQRDRGFIGAVEISARQQVYVNVGVQAGRQYVDIRVYEGYLSGKVFGPTMRGVRIPLEKSSRLLSLLERVTEIQEA